MERGQQVFNGMRRSNGERQMPTHENGGDDGGGGGNPKQRIYELLGFIRSRSFTANPPQVPPLGATTISWECSLPHALNGVVTLVVAGHAVTGPSPGTGTLSGSTSVVLDRTTEFGINAEYGPPDDPVVSRGVVGALLTVPVTDSECKTFVPPFGVLALVDTIKAAIQNELGAQLRDSPLVTPGDGTLSIKIPLNLNGQGTMDISMELWVQVFDPNRTGGVVTVTVHNLTVDVSLDFPGEPCEGAVTQVAQAFMAPIAAKLVALPIENGLNGEVQEFATTTQQADNPLHRVFVLTSMVLTPDELSFRLCPAGTQP
jgi:hypothetical protein